MTNLTDGQIYGGSSLDGFLYAGAAQRTPNHACEKNLF